MTVTPAPSARATGRGRRAAVALLTWGLLAAPALPAVASPPAVPAVATASGALAPAVAASDARSARTARCPRLRLSDRWYGDVGERLQRVIDRAGRCEGSPREHHRFAVFDWDNTMVKNDISDQTTFWLLRRSLLRQPPHRDWRTTSRWLSPAAARALREACGPLAAPGRRLPTGRRTPRAIACADEILSMRLEQTTTDGKPGFAGDYDHRRMNAGYAWMAQLMAGRRPERVLQIAADARRAALSAPQGATWRVGSTRQIRWIRYYRPMRDLVRTLKRAGITPWVVTASPELWADVWGRGIGIAPRHVIGIRTVVERGRVTTRLRGCGGYRTGSDRIMPYVEGKRCWTNKAILGIHGRAALRPAPAARRQVISAGDSSTDVVMVGDATRAHIAINRNSDELMCRAYDDRDGRWLVTPMFIDPLPQLVEGYPCSTAGAVQRDGSEGPARRPDGSVIPDQADRVHP